MSYCLVDDTDHVLDLHDVHTTVRDRHLQDARHLHDILDNVRDRDLQDVRNLHDILDNVRNLPSPLKIQVETFFQPLVPIPDKNNKKHSYKNVQLAFFVFKASSVLFATASLKRMRLYVIHLDKDMVRRFTELNTVDLAQIVTSRNNVDLPMNQRKRSVYVAGKLDTLEWSAPLFVFEPREWRLKKEIFFF